jgi:DNA-binding NtrC family response regulator
MDKKELIFLVEDNTIFASSVKKGLEKEMDFEIRVFETGEKLIEFIEANTATIPSMIVLDYELNSMIPEAKNGSQILTLLKDPSKRSNPYKKIPVIILTMRTDADIAVPLLKKGATDYIIKDEDFFINLKKTINNIIDVRKYKEEIMFHKNKAETYRKRLMLMAGVIIVMLAALFFLFK